MGNITLILWGLFVVLKNRNITFNKTFCCFILQTRRRSRMIRCICEWSCIFSFLQYFFHACIHSVFQAVMIIMFHLEKFHFLLKHKLMKTSTFYFKIGEINLFMTTICNFIELVTKLREKFEILPHACCKVNRYRTNLR